MRSSLVWLEEEPSEVHLVVALSRSRPAVVLDKRVTDPSSGMAAAMDRAVTVVDKL
jgi:hypothetical protein